jgi:hypothetical protein
LLELQGTTGKYGKVWDSLDFVACGERGKAFGVDFEHDGLSGQIVGHLSYVGRRHAAWPTPLGPEIDQDWDLAVANDLVEFFDSDFYGHGHRGQWGFAGAAFSCVRQVLGRNSVRLPTAWAVSDDGHDDLQMLDGYSRSQRG